MKQLSLETLLRMLVIAQHQVNEVTAEIKRRSDGRKQRPERKPYRRKKQEPRPEDVLNKEGTC